MIPDKELNEVSRDELISEIYRLRKGIRYHRDEKGDDRCWLDDQKLYELLPETGNKDFTLPPKEKFLQSCNRFWECRQGKEFGNMDKCYDGGSYHSLNLNSNQGTTNE